jgi:FkbM family methyltransferase
MISYSQNQEDVVLFRLVQLVPEGFYVDVGAAHPVLDNVTYALYEAGWRGINIEPMKREADLLREVRPRDITCQVAAGESSGHVTLYEAPIENRGATTGDKELVDLYRSTGQSFASFEVEVMRLDKILEDNQIKIVHILKIDVEGFEKSVIQGASIDKYRPWVLVIEATRPNSTVDVSAEWEQLVLRAGYVQALFDGLNKFYVRDDMPDLVALMSVPANVFDGWKSFEIDDLTRVIDDLSQQAVELHEKISQMSETFSHELAARESSFRSAEEYALSLQKRLAEIDNKDSSH